MIKSLIKSTNGLLMLDKFQDQTAWTIGDNWSFPLSPSLTAGARSAVIALFPGTGSDSDAGNVREGNLYVEDGVWYLYYDAGDGTTSGESGKWIIHLATSTDRGLTWTKHGAINIGLWKTSNTADGKWNGRGILWIGKFDGVYHLHALSALYESYNIPAAPYESDHWTATSLMGPWTFVERSAVIGATYDDVSSYGSCMVPNKGLYYLICGTLGSAEGYNCSISKSTSPYGPFEKIGSVILPESAGNPENPKVFYHPMLGKWVLLANQVNTGIGMAVANSVTFTDSLDDWSLAKTYFIQKICPYDGSTAIGQISPFFTGCGATVDLSESGNVPAVFDANPTDSNHMGRKLYYTSLIASANAATFSRLSAQTLIDDNFNRANGALGGDWATYTVARLQLHLTNVMPVQQPLIMPCTIPAQMKMMWLLMLL
jgi:hypothetical protein